jgi:hypothetical protein
MKNIETEKLNAQRRAALFNIKAANSGFKDYFGKDVKREKELDVERTKLLAILKKKGIEGNVDEILVKPGDKKHGN